MKNNVFQGIFKLIEHKKWQQVISTPLVYLYSANSCHIISEDSRYTAVVTFSLSTVTLCGCIEHSVPF